MQKRTQILLEPGHHDYLKREAKLRRSSISGVVRDLLDEKMAGARAVGEDADPVLGIIGKYASGRRDTSLRSKEILYKGSQSK